jgi:phosphoribosylglycinamide formyltransferase-1
MSATFISEPIYPMGDFDATGMSFGEPGLPEKFRWRRREFTIGGVLEKWKDYGDCKHGSGERYVRKHFYRLKDANGEILVVYFQRSFGKASAKVKSRWWLYSLENNPL